MHLSLSNITAQTFECIQASLAVGCEIPWKINYWIKFHCSICNRNVDRSSQMKPKLNIQSRIEPNRTRVKRFWWNLAPITKAQGFTVTAQNWWGWMKQSGVRSETQRASIERELHSDSHTEMLTSWYNHHYQLRRLNRQSTAPNKNRQFLPN